MSASASARYAWHLEDGDPHVMLLAWANKTRTEDMGRKLRMVEHLCLYTNMAFDDLGSTLYGSSKAPGAFERLSENHIENQIHAVHAECVQNRTRMTVVTSGGDYRMKRRAKELDKFSEGQAYEDGQEQVGNDAKLDALVWGTGIEFVYEDPVTKRVSCERVIGWELHAARDDARYGKPRSMSRTHIFDKEVLKACYPDKADEIERAPRGDVDDYPYYVDAGSNLIVVTEAWHLPSRAADPRKKNDKGSGDGRHAICVPGVTLLDEPWEKAGFPFRFIHWIRPRLGMWGKGMVEQLLGQQVELNRVLRHIQLSMKRAGNLKVFIDTNSGVLKTHINDRVGTMVTYNGQGGRPPAFVVHDVVSPQVIAHAQQIRSGMYSVEGLSQMSAQGTLPQGMDKASGRAIRMADSIASKRRLPFLRDCETFDREVAELKIETAKEIAERDGGYAVSYHGKRRIEVVDFTDINLKRDQWWMRVFPTSALPSEPSARIAVLDEWLNAKLISPGDYKRLADFPDLEDASTLDTAQYEACEEVVDLMLNEGIPYVVEELDDKEMWARLALMMYTRAKIQGHHDKKSAYPEQHMELVRQLIVDCLDKGPADAGDAAQLPPGTPEAPPGGGPPPPPTAGSPPGGLPPAPPAGAPPAPSGPPSPLH